MEQETPQFQKHTNTFLIVIIIVCILGILGVGVWRYINDVLPAQETSVEDEGSATVLDETTEPDDHNVSKDDLDLAQIGTPSGFLYDEDELAYDGDAPVYVTIYSHNEDSWSAKVNTPEKYYSYREGLIDRAELLAGYDVEWNWQSDQPVVEAMLEYEGTETFEETYDLSGPSGLNVLEYLETLGVHFDPHAHTNNYADVAYLIDQLGVEASSVIGGVTHVKCGDELYGFLDYLSWQNELDLQADGYVHGKDFPEAMWKPEILSDPGMGGHYFDDYSSGAWKPSDEDAFYTHDPNNEIIYIGEGYPHDVTVIGETHASGSDVWSQDGAYIKELVSKIENKELPTGLKTGEQFMYTASIHMRDTEVVKDGGTPVDTAEGMAALMDELQPLRDAGKIIFVDFEQAARIWTQEYNAVPYFVSLEGFSFYNDIREEAETHCSEQEPSSAPSLSAPEQLYRH